MIEYSFSTTELIKIISSRENIILIKILENVPIINRKLIPSLIGVYILKNGTGVQYIGCSSNIRMRIYGHKYKIVENVDIYLVDNIIDASILETILINLLKPTLNKYIPNSYNVVRKKFDKVYPSKTFIPMLEEFKEEHTTVVEEYRRTIIGLEITDLIKNFTGC